MFNGQKIMLAGEFWSLPQKLLLLSNVMNSSRFLLKGFNCNPPKILARCNFVCLDPAWIFIGQRFSSALTHAGSSCACSLGLLFIGPSIGCKILPPDNYNFSTFWLRRKKYHELQTGNCLVTIYCAGTVCIWVIIMGHVLKICKYGLREKTISKNKIKLTALYVAAMILTLSFSDLQSLTFKQVIHTSQ